MTKYKNIEKYMGELNMFPINMKDDLTFSDHGIKASDLEAILAKGVELYGEAAGDSKIPCSLSTLKSSSDTHSGLLIGYKPIESQEPVSKSEIETYLNHSLTSEEKSEDLLKRILKNGVRND